MGTRGTAGRRLRTGVWLAGWLAGNDERAACLQRATPINPAHPLRTFMKKGMQVSLVCSHRHSANPTRNKSRKKRRRAPTPTFMKKGM